MIPSSEREGEASLVCAAGPLFARQAAVFGKPVVWKRPAAVQPPALQPALDAQVLSTTVFQPPRPQAFLAGFNGNYKAGQGMPGRARENLLPGEETVLERIGGQRHGPRTVLERVFVFFPGIDPDFFLRGNGGQVCRKAFIGRAARKRFRRRGSARFDFFRKRSGRERVAEEFAQP